MSLERQRISFAFVRLLGNECSDVVSAAGESWPYQKPYLCRHQWQRILRVLEHLS